jgi:DNA-binding transcriptional LysR family regulator
MPGVTVRRDFTPELCGQMIEAMPNVTIEFEIGASHRLKDRMMSGALDVCLMHAPEDIPGMRRELLCEIETTWAAQPGVVHADVMNISDLTKYPIVTLGSEAESFHILATAMRAIGHWPLAHISTNYADMIVNTIKRTPSIGTVLKDSIHRELHSGELMEIKCDLVFPVYKMYACHSLTRSGKLVRNCVDLAVEFCRSAQWRKSSADDKAKALGGKGVANLRQLPRNPPFRPPQRPTTHMKRVRAQSEFCRLRAPLLRC